MITKFDKYNLIRERNFFDSEEEIAQFVDNESYISLPKINIGDKAQYVSDVIQQLETTTEIITNEQKEYVANNINETHTVIGKYYGDQWWSKFVNDDHRGFNDSWIQDKYLKQVSPTYTPKRFIREGLTDKMTPKSEEELKNIWDRLSSDLLKYVKEWGDFTDEEAIKMIEDNKYLIFQMHSDGHPPTQISHSVVFPEFHDGERTYEKKKTRLELKEEQQRKDEKRYLSEKERKRLNDSQRKYLVNKRKELGSWNDADLKNNQ